MLQIDPSVVQARANLGLMYYLSARYSEAAQEFSIAARADPNILPAQLFLGLSYLKLGAFQRAIPPLEKAKQLDPSNQQVARGLLACYIALGQYQDAATELQFFEERTDEESLYIAGQAYLDMGRSLTQRMAQNYRSSGWAHRLAGDLAVDRGDWNTAVDEYRKAIAADPEMPGIERALAAATAHQKQADSSESRSHSTNRETAQALYEKIRAYTRRGEEFFKKLQDSFPDSPYAHELRGDVYRLSQDFTAALQEFEAALMKRDDDAALHRSAAEMDVVLGRLQDAETELHKAARLNPGDAETEYLLGQVYSKSDGKTEQAVEHLRAAVRRDPNLLQARALLGTAYMHLNQPALAAPELEKALPLDYYGDLHFQLYRADRALGKKEEAGKALAISNELRAKSFRSTVAKISGAENPGPAPQEKP